MKTVILSVAAILATSHALLAQTFTATAGYLASVAFSVPTGFTISGLGTDSSGGIYYLENGPFGGGFNETRLFKRSTSDFTNPIQLYSYGGSVSGNFVNVVGNTVYFGEGTDAGGTIRSVNVNGGTSSTLVSVAGNYSFAAGISGAFVSANASQNPENKVFKLNLGTGALDTILTTTDYSGPIAVTSSGSLLYGATTFGSIAGGLFSFSSTQIGSVTDANPAQNDTAILVNSSSAPLISNESNQYLAYLDGQHLYQSYSPFNSSALIKRFSLSTGFVENVGATSGSSFLGAFALSGSSLYSVVTADYSNGPSSVYLIVPVPEPSSGWLLVCGGAWLLPRRRYKS